MTGDNPVVLVADDDEDILTLVAFRLEREGYEILRARNGEEALELARRRTPSLAVLDVTMPKLDGLAVTRALRASHATRNIPIILLTARAQEADLHRGLGAGADDYVRKPFSPHDLRLRVEAALGKVAA